MSRRKFVLGSTDPLPFWQSSARLAVHSFLKAEKDFEERPTHRKIYISDALIENAEGESSVSSEPEVAKKLRKRRFSLPWLPKRSVVPQLAAILRFAQTVPAPEILREICFPGSFTQLDLRGIKDPDGNVAKALVAAIEFWQETYLAPFAIEADVRVYFAPETSDGSSRYASSTMRSFSEKIADRLRSGHSVIVVTSDIGSIDPELSQLCGLSLDAPDISPLALAEIVRSLHRAAARLPVEELIARLPNAQTLKRVSLTQIETALRLPELDDMLSRLAPRPFATRAAPEVTLADVHGQDVAVDAFRGIIVDLQNWHRGELAWSEVASSAVMFGPPGNGKTMLAAAFAGSAGIPLVTTSYSECQRHGHQGDMLRALRAAFQSAEAAAPAVLFIDEIDSFSRRTSGGESDQYIRGVVNGLLTELSQAAKVPGLVLLAATNDLAVVDPAVIRPGRFDRKIFVGNPSMKGIRSILLKHLGIQSASEISSDDLDHILRELVGASGADVAGKAREALGLARAEGRSVTLEDLQQVVFRGRVRARPDDIYRAATHEAGHIIVQYVSGFEPPLHVYLTANGAAVLTPFPVLPTLKDAEVMLRCLLAGRVAERLCLGQISCGAGQGGDSDLAKATEIALKIECEWQLDRPLSPWTEARRMIERPLPQDLDAAVTMHLRHAEDSAEEMLRANIKQLRLLAGFLEEKREVFASELAAFLEGLGLDRSGDNQPRSAA